MKDTILNLDAFDIDVVGEDGVDDSVEILLKEDGLVIPGDASVVGVTFTNDKDAGQINILLHVHRGDDTKGVKYSTIMWPKSLRDASWVLENHFP